MVREEGLGGKGKLKIKMVLTGEGTGLKHVVEGEIDLRLDRWPIPGRPSSGSTRTSAFLP